MYNRYIPDGAVYTRVTVEEEEAPLREPAGHRRKGGSGLPPVGAGLLEGAQGSLKDLIASLGLEKLDSGDLLLFLILLLILKEGDDLELVIVLGLTLLMSLGDGKKREE